MKELDVVAALIEKDDKYLLSLRNKDDKYGDLWEFPGGTVEDGEKFEEAIVREIKEELDLSIAAENLINVFEDENLVLKIRVALYRCYILTGSPKPVDCQDFGFFSLLECRKLDLAPVDRKIVNYLIGLF